MSNMFPIHDGLLIDGLRWKTSESFYQACKSKDSLTFFSFIGLDGYEAKKLGNKIDICSEWDDENKIDVMGYVIDIKFNIKELGDKLCDVTEPIVEDNYWNDTFWGVCKGVGEDHLGRLLREKRDRLIKERKDRQ